MGNICGKASDDPFAQPGRTLSSVPPPSNTATAPIPKTAPKSFGGAARTLGSSPSQQTATTATGGTAQLEARRKAAEAAEARAKGAKPKGKLGSQLQEQKKQSQKNTLEETSAATRRQRDADEAANSRAYN